MENIITIKDAKQVIEQTTGVICRDTADGGIYVKGSIIA